MREYKFRGKRVDNGDWVYGVPYTKEIFSTEHKKIIGYKTYIITYLADDLRSIERDEVDPNTVGQYTGLKDKNGKEIYEGNIVRYEFDGTTLWAVCGSTKVENIIVRESCVQYDTAEYRLYGRYENSKNDVRGFIKLSQIAMSYIDGNCTNIEVIGNIHDKGEQS